MLCVCKLYFCFQHLVLTTLTRFQHVPKVILPFIHRGHRSRLCLSLYSLAVTFKDTMDDSIKRQIIKSVIAFLLPEARDGNREADQRDAIEVAIQCLENAYSLEGHRNDDDIVDLVEVFQKLEKPKIKKEVRCHLLSNPRNQICRFQVSKEDSEKAEILKTEGNEAMRAQKFSEAVDKYSK